MIFDYSELERRKPVWSALSDLWLDSELTDDDLERIAAVMEQSDYTIDELREIYRFEEAPVVFMNLFQVAGEWAGFDEDWLCAEAAKRANNRSLFLRAFVKLGIGKWIMTYATERYWARLVEPLGKSC